MQHEEIETMPVQVENAKFSLKSVYAIIVCTIIILGYLTALKSSVSDIGHNVDLIRQANDNDRSIINLKMDMMQKQIDGNSQQIKTQQDEIEQLKLNEQKK
jgi:hypothetical protein